MFLLNIPTTWISIISNYNNAKLEYFSCINKISYYINYKWLKHFLTVIFYLISWHINKICGREKFYYITTNGAEHVLRVMRAGTEFSVYNELHYFMAEWRS